MFKTMPLIKTSGALIGMLLTLLLVHWGATSLYTIGHGGHEGAGGEPAPQAYTIAVEEAAPADAAAPAEQVDVAAVLAAGDPAKGEKDFGKCRGCHNLEGKDGVGPHLNGVVGRAVASVAGFGYDAAMKDHAAVTPNWTPEALFEFLAAPKTVVPGTKMNFNGLPKPEDRADLIAFLASKG